MLELSAPAVHRFVAQRIANRQDAEDIAQQVLLQALAKLSTFRGRNFQAWIFTISRHLVIDHYRTRNRVQFVEVSEAASGEAEPALQTGSDQLHSVCDCRARLGRWVHCVTQRLRLEQQVAVLLSDVHGYSDKASAAELEMTLPSFKLLLHEARSILNAWSGGSCTLLAESKAEPIGLGRAGFHPHGARGNSQIGPCSPGAKDPGCVVPLGSTSQPPCAGGDRQATAPSACGGQHGGRAQLTACLGANCLAGANCRLGIKCCRRIPKLMELRARLLEPLVFD